MMTRITFGTVVGLACSAAIALGLPQNPPAPQTSAKLDDKPTTIVGCVQTGNAPGQFVLTASTPDARPSSPSAADKATKYELVSQGEVDLQKLIGKRVEVTGVVSSTPTLTRSPDPTPAASARVGNEPMIMKMVAKSAKDVAPGC